jgi:hypothetical protein
VSPEGIYVTPVQNLLAVSMFSEEVDIEGDAPKDFTLRRGLTLVPAAKEQ